MSFLTEIKSFIKTEILEIEEPGSRTSSSQTGSNKAIIECETENLEDKFIQTSKGNNKCETNVVSQRALEETIANIPAKTINIKQMIKEGLLNKVTGLAKEELEKLSARQKVIAFKTIQASIKKYEALKANGEIDKSANIEELVISYATNAYQAITNGIFENETEYENASKNINKELGNDFGKKNKAERREKFKRLKAEYKKAFNAQIEEIKKLPEEQRKVEMRKLLLRRIFLTRKQFLEILTEQKTEVAVDAMHLLDSEDLEYGAQTIIQTRNSDEEKTKAADYADYNFTKDLIQANAANGEKINSEKLKGYTETFMGYKSTEAAYEYQSSYTSDRKMYENALRKKQAGETLTPEEEVLLSYMETDYYTATAQGIGVGALNNINMSSEEKAKFISKWENDAKQFNDYVQVTSEIKKIIAEKEDYKEIKEELKKIKLQEQSNKTPKNNEYENKSDVDKTSSSEYNQRILNEDKNNKNSVNLQTTNNTHNSKEPIQNTPQSGVESKEKSTQTMSTNPIKLAQNIRIKGIEQAIQEYGSDAISLILDTSGLKHLRPRLTTIIRSYDLNTLIEISQSCSDSSFIYICNIINKNYVEKLKENRDNTRGLCYAAEKQLKDLEGKNESV